MKPELKLGYDLGLPDGEMLCFDAQGKLLARQPSHERPPEGSVRISMSAGDLRRMLQQLGIIGTGG